MLQKTISLDVPDSHDDHGASNTVLGFWVYLMTDCIIFASLFAVFAVMGQQFAGGPTGQSLFDIQGVALETAILLLSSITFGFGMLAAHKGKRTRCSRGSVLPSCSAWRSSGSKFTSSRC